jgi:hypothetical protein
MMLNSEKVLENRLRRVAARRGWKIVKSRVRDTKAIGFGHYSLLDAKGKRLANVATLTLIMEILK